MTIRIYLGSTAFDRLAQAQHEIDQHAYTVRGFCVACREPAPCSARENASNVFARYHQLPRRRPGLALRGEPTGESMTIDHQVRRPDWLCGTEGIEWPCESARKLLAEAYREDRDGLARHVAHLMAQAAGDLGIANPSLLYRRFLGWTLARGEGCRVCGRSTHAVIPGLPPRLFPCDGGARPQD